MLTSNGLVSCPGEVKGSHPLNTTESGDKRQLHGPLGWKTIKVALSEDGRGDIFTVMSKGWA